jgi:hypothetical protein
MNAKKAKIESKSNKSKGIKNLKSKESVKKIVVYWDEPKSIKLTFFVSNVKTPNRKKPKIEAVKTPPDAPKINKSRAKKRIKNN